MANIKTEIYDNQLKESYLFTNLINTANGVAGLDNSTKLSISLIPDITNNTDVIKEASTIQKGIVQLSGSYTGSNENLAVNEKALSTGLSNVRTYFTDSNIFTVANGDINVGQTIINISNIWPTTELFGVSVYRNGLYQNDTIDFHLDAIDKSLVLSSGVISNEKITVVFDWLLNAEVLNTNLYHNAGLTGIPTAPTASDILSDTNQIATTAFVQNAFSYYIGGHQIIVSETEPIGLFNDNDIWIDIS